MTRHVGFTGTQRGMTAAQQESLQREFMSLDSSYEQWLFHHGDCIGADEEADKMARAFGAKIIIHPPDKDTKRAFCSVRFCDMRAKPKPYLERNKDIVGASSILFAAPDGPERQRSGTWSTVRYARKIKCDYKIFMPDGSVE